MFGLFLALGMLFGALAALAAYLIAYHEYRQRFLRPDQNATAMALQTGAVTFAFFVLGSVVLYFALRPSGG